jgi:hypothetical protein
VREGRRKKTKTVYEITKVGERREREKAKEKDKERGGGR